MEYWIDDVGRFNWETVPVQGKQISFVADDVRRERGYRGAAGVGRRHWRRL